jgi:hypothetical protein
MNVLLQDANDFLHNRQNDYDDHFISHHHAPEQRATGACQFCHFTKASRRVIRFKSQIFHSDTKKERNGQSYVEIRQLVR